MVQINSHISVTATRMLDDSETAIKRLKAQAVVTMSNLLLYSS